MKLIYQKEQRNNKEHEVKPQITRKEQKTLILDRYHRMTGRKMWCYTYERMDDIIDVMIKAFPELLRPSDIENKVRWRFWFIRNKNPKNVVQRTLKLLKELDIVRKKVDRGKLFYDMFYKVVPKSQETEIDEKLPIIFKNVIQGQMDYENLRNYLFHSDSYRTVLSVIDAIHDLKKAVLEIKLKISTYDIEILLSVVKNIEVLTKIYQVYYRTQKFPLDEEQAAYLKLVEILHRFYNIKLKGW